jgi:hypothetical protein
MLPMLTSVQDILHFATDPDPALRIRTSDYTFILLISFEGTFKSFFTAKKPKKSQKR